MAKRFTRRGLPKGGKGGSSTNGFSSEGILFHLSIYPSPTWWRSSMEKQAQQAKSPSTSSATIVRAIILQGIAHSHGSASIEASLPMTKHSVPNLAGLKPWLCRVLMGMTTMIILQIYNLLLDPHIQLVLYSDQFVPSVPEYEFTHGVTLEETPPPPPPHPAQRAHDVVEPLPAIEDGPAMLMFDPWHTGEDPWAVAIISQDDGKQNSSAVWLRTSKTKSPRISQKKK